ncbi:hypothetical protein [Thermococcus thermotolerans]|uniref:hypothetical protein n=1 Tax=Thermococcus thermotolerans TaxID=2969672 RepID=UPI0021574FA3|nr:hypothetical protein [Thermococcus thermotolerans]
MVVLITHENVTIAGMAVVRKLTISIALSVIISFLAWIAVQIHFTLGAVLFISAVLLPQAIFWKYYGKKPHMLAPFLVISLVSMALLTPPLVTGPNVEFGLHQITGCWEGNGDAWPIEGAADVMYSCNQVLGNSTVRVIGAAWKSMRVELPLLGDFVTIYEPRGKVDKAYNNATKRIESKGYIKLVEDYGTYSGILEDDLFIRGEECIYLAKTRVLGGGLAVVSTRGSCSGVKEFALRWHDDYLWNVSEPPIFERYRFNWSSSSEVKTGRLVLSEWPDEWIKNTYHNIGVELRGTGYVKKAEGKRGDCRWSLWTRNRNSYYVALKGKKILVLSGETGAVKKAAEELSPCGLENGREVDGVTPEEVLSAVIEELNDTFSLKPTEWKAAPWALSGGEFSIASTGGKSLKVAVLVYGIPEQCGYARYLLETSDWRATSICFKRGRYFVVVAVKGDVESVNAVLSSIFQPKRI